MVNRFVKEEKSSNFRVNMLIFSKGVVCMSEENKPFNDVIDHFNKIEGNVGNPANEKLQNLPKPIKYIGYFMIGFFALSFILVIILNLIN
jgi:hypothetical protein